MFPCNILPQWSCSVERPGSNKNRKKEMNLHSFQCRLFCVFKDNILYCAPFYHLFYLRDKKLKLEDLGRISIPEFKEAKNSVCIVLDKCEVSHNGLSLHSYRRMPPS